MFQLLLLLLALTADSSGKPNPLRKASSGRSANISHSPQAPFYPSSYKGPVIGILTQKTNGNMVPLGHSYIAASYVKYLESAGAQVIPLFDSLSLVELHRTLESLNGVLLPGGAQVFPNSSYHSAASHIYRWVVDRNRNGTYFPLWGTCLGFEAILDVAANTTTDIRFRCSAHGANNLTILDGAQDSRMLYALDDGLFGDVLYTPLVYNAHDYCISPDTMLDRSGVLYDTFKLLAVDWDSHEARYAALVEHRDFPIYGSQFHPEKSAFEWTPFSDIPHSVNSVKFMQYLANFFVGEARRNKQRFADPRGFYRRSINNYGTVYTLVTINSKIESCYFFDDPRDDLDIDTTD